MRRFRTSLVFALAFASATRASAQESVDPKDCARLLPAIERLEAMLAQEAKVRTVESETQRMQVVMTLLGVRYQNIESLQSSLRSYESEEDDLRAAMAREQARLESIEEAARSATTPIPDAERKMQRADSEAVLKGLEEKVKGLRERKSTTQGQLAIERHDLEKLEAIVRAWIEKLP